MVRRKGLSKSLLAAIVVIVVIIVAAAVLMMQGGGGAVKEVKVGVVLPLSGKLAETGADLKRGLEFAVEEINAAGGIKSLGGAKIVLVFGDSAGKPETGAAEAERLITEEKVVAMLGSYQSAVTKTVSEVCERYHVPMLNPESTSPTLTARGYKWFFRTTPHDEMFAKQHVDFVNWLNKKYGNQIKRIAIIHEDTEWGTATARAWQKYFTQAGYQIVKVVSYHAATITSMDSEIDTLKAANPDLVLVASYVQDAILFVQTAKQRDFNPKAILAQDAGFINPSYVKQVGKDGFYIFSREVFNWDLGQKIPKLKEVNDRYKAKYGVDLNGNSARDYTGAWVLYYALEEAGKKASPANLEEFRKAIRDALASLNIPGDKLIMPWKGVKFDSNGQNTLGQGIVVQMMEDGKYHTVFPEEFATAEPVFPMPKWSERG